jgi:hypothetical protein
MARAAKALDQGKGEDPGQRPLITPESCGDTRHHLARTRVYGGLMPREQRLRVVLLVAAAIIVAASIVATVATGRLYLMGFCGLVAVVLLPLSLRRR